MTENHTPTLQGIAADRDWWSAHAGKHYRELAHRLCGIADKCRLPYTQKSYSTSPGVMIPEPIVSVANPLSDDRRDARVGLLGDPRVACAYDAAANHQALATAALSPCRSRARRCLALWRRCFTFGRDYRKAMCEI
jgi:hypothetical protein